MSPLRSSSLKCSQVAQCGTRLELAMSTRGASGWVRNTPTGLPDCTSSVSSASSVLRGAADAAVNHELLGTLCHLRVEVVHEHAHGRFRQPALGRDLVAAVGPHHA